MIIIKQYIRMAYNEKWSMNDILVEGVEFTLLYLLDYLLV